METSPISSSQRRPTEKGTFTLHHRNIHKVDRTNSAQAALRTDGITWVIGSKNRKIAVQSRADIAYVVHTACTDAIVIITITAIATFALVD